MERREQGWQLDTTVTRDNSHILCASIDTSQSDSVVEDNGVEVTKTLSDYP